MFVRDFMSTQLVTISPRSMVIEAMQPLLGGKFRHLPVSDGGRLVGLLTQTDLLGLLWKRSRGQRLDLLDQLGHLPVEEVMVRDLHTIGPDEAVEHAALAMRDHRIGCLPVVEGKDQLVGILTETNVFDAMVDAMGLRRGGARIDQPLKRGRECETIAELVERWRRDSLWPVSLATYRSRSGDGMHIVARVRGAG